MAWNKKSSFEKNVQKKIVFAVAGCHTAPRWAEWDDHPPSVGPNIEPGKENSSAIQGGGMR